MSDARCGAAMSARCARGSGFWNRLMARRARGPISTRDRAVFRVGSRDDGGGRAVERHGREEGDPPLRLRPADDGRRALADAGDSSEPTCAASRPAAGNPSRRRRSRSTGRPPGGEAGHPAALAPASGWGPSPRRSAPGNARPAEGHRGTGRRADRTHTWLPPVPRPRPRPSPGRVRAHLHETRSLEADRAWGMGGLVRGGPLGRGALCGTPHAPPGAVRRRAGGMPAVALFFLAASGSSAA
jgi:hypothetical protein